MCDPEVEKIVKEKMTASRIEKNNERFMDYLTKDFEEGTMGEAIQEVLRDYVNGDELHRQTLRNIWALEHFKSEMVWFALKDVTEETLKAAEDRLN